LAIGTLVQVCQGTIKGVTPRDRVAAANAILDRGYGKPTQAIDLIMLGKKISELSTAELIELNSRLVSSGATDAAQLKKPKSTKPCSNWRRSGSFGYLNSTRTASS
jgi:hypothetical protein